MSKILIVEDDQSRCDWFRSKLAGAEIDLTCDVRQAVAWLEEREYATILLDHDLTEEHYFTNEPDDERTGYAVALWLSRNSERQRDANIIIHSLNYAGAQRMLQALQDAGRDAEHVPFPYLQSGMRF